MTELKSPTAVLHEGPRALTDEQVREMEESDLAAVRDVDIDDVIEYVHKDLKALPDFTTLYRKYLKQRWDVYDLDFSQDVIDWQEKMTEEERQSFIAVASGFHHGERQVEIELQVQPPHAPDAGGQVAAADGAAQLLLDHRPGERVHPLHLRGPGGDVG